MLCKAHAGATNTRMGTALSSTSGHFYHTIGCEKGQDMNTWSNRISFVVWTLLVGVVLSYLDAPTLVIRIPWIVVWAALVFVIGLGVPVVQAMLEEHHSHEPPSERFPEIYDVGEAYLAPRTGPTIRLDEVER